MSFKIVHPWRLCWCDPRTRSGFVLSSSLSVFSNLYHSLPSSSQTLLYPHSLSSLRYPSTSPSKYEKKKNLSGLVPAPTRARSAEFGRFVAPHLDCTLQSRSGCDIITANSKRKSADPRMTHDVAGAANPCLSLGENVDASWTKLQDGNWHGFR